jgi:hypothetical protein
LTRARLVTTTLIASALASLAHPLTARADEDVRATCVASYEDALAKEKRGALVEARRAYISCAAAACPKPVRTDCATYAEKISANLPSVVLGLQNEAGQDVFPFKATIDDKPVVNPTSGEAIELDPGPHVVRFEAANTVPVEMKILLRAGERNRPLIARIAVTAKPREDPPPPPPPASDRGGIPTAAYVAGGVGVVGLGMFTGFAIAGASEKSHLKDTCSPRCTDSEVSALRRDYIVADVSLAIGLVALGVATFFVLTAPSKNTARIPAMPHHFFARTIWK